MEHTEMLSRLPLIGRQRELAVLHGHYESTTAGRAQVVLLTGDPGIGKTRILEAVALYARQQGARVLRGGASEAEGMPPYLPFLEALGRHIRSTTSEELRQQTGAMASVLATIFPELPLHLGELPASFPLPPEQMRLRLYEAVGLFLAAIADTAPLLLTFDDLQWADPSSLDLLRHIIRQQPASRFLILGAYRPGEVVGNPALERTLLDLRRDRVLASLNIGPLATEEIAVLASSALGTPVASGMANLLHMHSEGNPFFAEELLRAWHETSAFGEVGGQFVLISPLDSTIPSSIVGIVRERLSRLPIATVETLRAAALIGRTFEVAFLAEVLGQEPEAVEETLLAARQAGIIRVDGQDIMTFSHDKVRECLTDDLSPIRRRRLHGFIGHCLEAQTAQQDAQHLADLAFHYSRSGDRPRGASYAWRAAEQACQAFAAEDAMKLFRTVLNLLLPQDTERGIVLLRLGETAILAGREREAIETLEEAQNWFQQRQDQIAAARAAHGIGRAWGRLEAHAAAQAAMEMALALVADHPGPERVQILADLATLLAVSLGSQREGISYGDQAIALARHIDDCRLEAIASRTMGNLLMRTHRLDEAIPLLEYALTLAKSVDDPVEASECCACLTLAFAWRGQLSKAQEITRERLEFAQRSHEPYQSRHMYTWLAMIAIVQGRFAEAAQWLAQAQPALTSLASSEPRAFLIYAHGFLAYSQGDYAVAEDHFHQAVDLFREMGPNVLVWYLAPLGQAQLLQGKRDEALECLHEVEGLLSFQAEDVIVIADAMSKLSLMAMRLDDRERIARYYQKLLSFQGCFVDVFIDRILGEMEIILGLWTPAQHHLSAAEEAARREGITAELAHTLVAQGRLKLSQGGRGSVVRARLLFEEAQALYEQLGLQKEAQALREQRDHLPGRSPSRKTRHLPAGLSAREVEVLCLIATGKSNRQIADELTLSERTVANHLAHIFTKTGTANRAAAAAFAIRHGLA